MPNHQSIPTSARQLICARVSETRRVPLSEERFIPRGSFLRIIVANNERLVYHCYTDYLENGTPYTAFECIRNTPLPHERNQRNINHEHPMEGIEIINLQNEGENRDIHVTYERIIECHGERLSESNNLCRECLMPIVLGNELCEECKEEEQIILQWMF
nr:5851_t:CDS:2 [Entrophospora candida]